MNKHIIKIVETKQLFFTNYSKEGNCLVIEHVVCTHRMSKMYTFTRKVELSRQF